jgi:hypothetical protein
MRPAPTLPAPSIEMSGLPAMVVMRIARGAHALDNRRCGDPFHFAVEVRISR